MATEFTLESVRQYMLAHEGRVTNHDLVKHYKAWLTHPTLKESSRQKFKEYVNTLSTIKVEDGVKFLVLKRKYFPTFADPTPQNAEPSLLDEVLGAYDRRAGPPAAPPTVAPPPVYKAPPPPTYRQPPPPPPVSQQAFHNANPTSPTHATYQNNRPSPPSQPPATFQNNHPTYQQNYSMEYNPVPMDYGLPLPSDFGLPNPRQGVFHPPGGYYNPPPVPTRNMSRSSSVMSSSDLSRSSSRQQLDLDHMSRSSSKQHLDPDHLSRSGSRQQLDHDQPPPLPTRNNKEASPMSSSMGSSANSSRKASISEDKENEIEKEKISVKERTKTFNRMASEVEVTKVKEINNIPDQKRRKNSNRTSRATSQNRDELDSHDSSSISTLDQVVKQWMVAAAKCDYTTLFKMLRDDPRLAKAKDFTSGYTALHWAAKHGNLDLVKLLAGQYGANTNIRSHGGYTPLHLACQFDHQEVFDILVKAYGADPNLRDYAGKKPRQYMATTGFGLHNMSNDTFRYFLLLF